MLNTRFTTQGKRKPARMPGLRRYALCLMLVFSAAFLLTGFRFMVTFDSQAATLGPRPAASFYAPTPSPFAINLSAKETALHSANPVLGTTPTPSPTPAHSPAPTAQIIEDAENGIWKYETETFSIDISRQRPLENAVATVAVLSGDKSQLRSAFAGETYGRNIRQRTSEIAKDVGAVFAINGDYCGYRDDGVIIRNATLYRDKPAREMLAMFSNGNLLVVDEAGCDPQMLIDHGVTDTFSFGPVLVNNSQIPENLTSDVSGTNPRTAIGQREDGELVFVVVDGRLPGYSEGMTIDELAQYMLDLGCKTAYNLDGGMTSCMVFNDQVISRPCGTGGRERPLSDVLCVLRVDE